MIELKNEVLNFVKTAEEECKEKFAQIEEIEFYNQLKVLNAFNSAQVEARHFIGSTGYGHNDIGKEKICEVFAKIYKCEDAFVSPLISCGTEAISQSLFGLLRPGDNMLCISGTPYDTLKKVIYGEKGRNIGSLKDYKIGYSEVDLINNQFDTPAILKAIKKQKPKLIYIQRSRGYSLRNALNISQIEEIISEIRRINKTAIIMVDNCYGEFTETREPTEIGADLVVGSLLKNMGGGVAPTGGYMAGKKDLIELISYKFTSPALGVDIGSYEAGYKSFFEGVFVAPHVVTQSMKLTALASVALSKLGYYVNPKINDTFSDIVCCINFKDKNKLIKFTRAIQNVSAVDSNSILEAGEMDGYEDLIIMASGSFNQGSSIELSCDGPMREPYAGYLQGSLTYQHGKIGLTYAIQSIWGN